MPLSFKQVISALDGEMLQSLPRLEHLRTLQLEGVDLSYGEVRAVHFCSNAFCSCVHLPVDSLPVMQHELAISAPLHAALLCFCASASRVYTYNSVNTLEPLS